MGTEQGWNTSYNTRGRLAVQGYSQAEPTSRLFFPSALTVCSSCLCLLGDDDLGSSTGLELLEEQRPLEVNGTHRWKSPQAPQKPCGLKSLGSGSNYSLFGVRL